MTSSARPADFHPLPSTTELIDLQGWRYHVRHWGDRAAPPVFLLHGWMDTSVTFQFIADALASRWHLIAPDWRGYGHSEWRDGSYWLIDLIGDLDRLLDRYTPDRPAHLVGHSMGGNIASLTAAVRPERVDRVVMLDAYGPPVRPTDEALDDYRVWLAQLRQPAPPQRFESCEALAHRMTRLNRRLTPARAAFLAEHGTRTAPDGNLEMLCDPAHRPLLDNFSIAYAHYEALWPAITAPLLHIVGTQSHVRRHLMAAGAAAYAQRLALLRTRREVLVEDAGHNVHHDQPEVVAAMIDAFLAAPA